MWLYRFLKTCDSISLYRDLYGSRIKSKTNDLGQFPAELSIETINLCNARCTICAHPDMRRKKSLMDTSLANGLIEQAAQSKLQKLFLSGFGEPLLDKRLPEFVALAKSRGINDIGIVTNGYLLTPDIAGILIESGLTEIVISIDGFTAESYEKIRLGLKFDRLVKNIQQLSSLKNRSKVRVRLSCVDLVTNHNQKKIAHRLFGRYVDGIDFRQAQGWTALYGQQIAFRTPHFIPNPIPCRYLWDSMSVYIDGTVPACCLDYEAKGVMGNAAETPLSDIWNGNRFADYRQAHLEGRKSELEPCHGCGYYSVWW
jgi:MoaA/NifB/PqqE/SkfB family radical SAM enzyme